MVKRQTTIFFSIGAGLALATVLTIFVARGYKINLSQKKVQKTGMLLVESVPDEAKIFLDGELIEATAATIPLPPRDYHLKIEKEGFSAWEKDVPVLPELVTEVSALLIPKSPQLTPLTHTGISLMVPSPSNRRIAYTTRGGVSPGLWILNLSPPPILGLVQENPRPIAEDTEKYAFSLAENLHWPPKEDALLVTLNKRGYILLKLGNGATPQTTSSAQPILTTWDEELLDQKAKWARSITLPEELKETALLPTTLWSPDRKRFLYTTTSGDYEEYRVYNGRTPIGTGKQAQYTSLRVKADSEVVVSWHATSDHLIIQEQGTISLIEIDGKNKKEVYSGKTALPYVAPTPDGKNLIILASFKQAGAPELYAISLQQ